MLPYITIQNMPAKFYHPRARYMLAPALGHFTFYLAEFATIFAKSLDKSHAFCKITR